MTANNNGERLWVRVTTLGNPDRVTWEGPLSSGERPDGFGARFQNELCRLDWRESDILYHVIETSGSAYFDGPYYRCRVDVIGMRPANHRWQP